MDVTIDITCPHCGKMITVEHEIELDPQDYLNDRD